MTDIASGSIRIDLDDKAALAGLRSIEERFNQTMARIDRDEATVTIDADTAKFDTAVKQSERKLAGIDRRHAVAELELKTAQFDDELKRAQLHLKKLEGEKAEVQLKIREGDLEKLDKEIALAKKNIKAVDGERATAHLNLEWNKAEFKAAEARVKAIEARTQELERLTQRVHDEEARRTKKELAWQRQKQKVSESLTAQKFRELDAAEKEAHRMEALRNREIASIPKLRLAYSSLARELDALAVARQKVRRSPEAAFHVELKQGAVLAEMTALKAKLLALGEEPPVRIHIEPGEDFGRRMRTTVHDGFRRSGVRQAAMNAGVLAGRDFSEGIVHSIGRNMQPRILLGGLVSIGAKIGKALGGLSDMTVRLGPFTATIRQAFVGLSVLAPVILDIVGALGALVAVAGSAALGVGALSLGLVGGAIPAALGMGLVLKDTVQEFKAAKAATKAYNDAVSKHGEGSDQAAKKLGELQHVLKGVSKETAQQFVLGQKLGRAWDQATKPAHASVWKAIGNALGVANNIMPMFAKNTNDAMNVAEKGTSKWLKGLDSVEGHATLNTLMQNFNKTLGPVMGGLGQLVGYFAKIGAYASNVLPSLGKTFENWAKGLNATADGSSAFQGRIDKIIQSAKDVGRFFLAAGRFIKTFFAGGVTAGQNFVNTMTGALNRWTAFLSTTEGQNKLGRFFQEAVNGAEGFFATLAPITTSFVRWAALIAPVVRNLLDASAAVTGFLAWLLRLSGLNGPLTALVTTLGFLWGIGKISAATRAVSGFTRALFGMAAAERVAAVSGGTMAAATGAAAAGGAARAAGTVRAAEAVALAAGAGAAAGGVGKLARAGGVATKVLAGLGAATVGVASVTAGLSVVAAAAGFGIYKYMTRTRDWEKAAKAADKASQGLKLGLAALAPSSTSLAQSTLDLTSSQKSLKETLKQSTSEESKLNSLREKGKKGTREYIDLNNQHKQTLMDVRQAQLSESTAAQNRQNIRKQDLKLAKDDLRAAKDNLKARQDSLKGLGDNKTGSVFGIGGTKISDGFKTISKEAAKAGKSVREFLATSSGRHKASQITDADIDQVAQYAKKLDQVRDANNTLRTSEDKVALAALNHRRALAGLGPIADSAARALANVAKKAGGKLSQTISLKFAGAGDAGKVANAASRALNAGVPKKIVTKIVADSKTAEEAIRRVTAQARALQAMRAAVKLGASDAASAKIRAIVARVNAIPDKEARIKARDQATTTIAKIISRISGVDDKTARMIARDLATGKINAVLAAINALHDKTVTITTRNVGKVSGGAAGAALGPHAASGKPIGKRMSNALIGEGGGPEWRVNTDKGFAYKTTGPEFANLDKNDAIIPTEPKYKSRGREIMKKVASDLGMKMFASGKTAGSSPFGSFGPDGFSPKAAFDRKKKFKASKKKHKPFTARRGWADYIEGLQTQQGYAEREVAIRESQVKEPADMAVITGYNAVTDPATGEVTQVPIYGPNPEIESSYKPALAAVLQAMQSLMSIIVELVRAIPQAIMANRSERGYHNAAIATLDDEIHKDKVRINHADKSHKEKYKNELQRDQDRRAKHVEARDQLKESEKTLVESRVDAGFDQREADIAQASMQDEYNSASGKGVAAAAEQNLQNTPSVSGGAGDASGSAAASTGDTSQLSYDQQSAMADSEKANILRQFGSNMAANLVGAIVGSSPGGSGPGALNVALRSGAGGAAAAGAALTGGSGGVAVSSGAGAASPAQTAAGASRTVNITNNFQQPPPDPHSFIQGVQFEAQAAL